MFNKRIALILSFLVLGLFPTAIFSQQTPTQTLIERARLLDAQGRHDMAAENWRQVLLLDPRQPDSVAALAEYYRTAGDATKAHYYQSLLASLNPSSVTRPPTAVRPPSSDNSEKLSAAARLNAAHKYSEALAIFHQAFGTTPPDNWAIAYYQTEAALPAESAHGIAGLRGLSLKYPANPTYQLALAQQLTYRPATRGEGLRLLALVQGTAAQNEEARASWRTAILWDPASPAALESAKQYVDRYPDEDLTARVRAAGQKNAAEAATSPEEGAAYRALATGNLSEAAAHFSALKEEAGHAANGELGLGYVCMQQKDFQAAVNHFESARAKGIRSATLDKTLREARYWSAMSSGNDALQAKDASKAATEFARAREVDNHRPEAAEALAGSMIAAQEPQQAEEIFATDVKNNPNRPDAWMGWMNALLEAGKFAGVLNLQPKVPSSVRAQLVQRPDYLAMLLCSELAQGNSADSRMLRDRIAKTGSGSGEADADVQAARILFRYSYFDDASKLSVDALNRDTNNSEAWQILIQSEHMAGRDGNALSMMGRMPRTADTAAMSNASFVLALASIYQSDGQLENAQALLDRAQKLSSTDQGSLIQLEMQKASLAQAQGNSQLALQIYQRINGKAPEQLDAWIGMLSALHAGNRDADALQAIHELPETVSSKLRHDAAFLEIAGFIYSGTGHAQEALLCLRAVTDHYQQQHQPMPFGAAIELAWLQLNTGDQRQLAATLDHLSKQHRLSLSQTIAIRKVWVAWSMRQAEEAFTSGDAGRSVTILEAALKAYPGESQLWIQLAGMYVRTGHAGQGMKIFQKMNWNNASVDQFTSGINAAIATGGMKDARYWLYLGLEKYPGNDALLRAGAHIEERKGDLKSAEKYLQLATASERSQSPVLEPDNENGVEAPGNSESSAPASQAANLSPASSLARILAASDDSSGSAVPAIDILGSSDRPATESLPRMRVQSLAAQYQQESVSENESSGYLQSGVYYHGGKADMVRVGTGQADTKTAVVANDGWQTNGLGASGYSSSGAEVTDRGHAVMNVHDSMADPLHGRDLGLTSDGGSGERTISNGDDSNLTLAELLDSAGQHPQESLVAGSENDLEAKLLGTGTSQPEAFLGSATSRVTALPNPAVLRGAKPSQQPTPTDELAEMQARYSPWILASGVVSNHSGTAGFDHLQDYEADLAASTVFGTGAARVSVITRPVMLQSGVPDSTANYRFGSGSTLPTDTQFASGAAASLQLATRNLQASAGISPSGFLVKNVIGNVSFRPFSGQFAFNAYRASQKDSLLSYAGIKDPDTGQIWGGVVATGGSLQFARGGPASGFYASIDGQKLTGVSVKDNTRIMGNAGAYWLAYSNQYGELKIGANLTAMHYALNERYFTIGQGGYFSPDAFLLMNAPITWQARPIHNTTYMIGGSLGAQSIQESAAMSGSLITGTGVETTAGASYDMHFKLAHRMDAHWTVEGFLDANNARQYADTSTGFTVRYASHPEPTEAAGPGFLNVMEPLPLQAP